MNSGLERVEELTRKLSLLTGEDHSNHVRVWLVSNPKARDQLLSMLELKYLRLTEGKDDLWLEPIPEHKITGDLTLGKVMLQDRELYDFTMPTENLLRHVTIFGHSGSGKTNLGYLILQHLLKKKMPFLVFDWKRNYRDLLALNTEQFVTVYTVGRGLRPFSINPLIPPPGTSPEVWLKKITEIIARAYYVGEGVMSILHRGIDAVYETFGVYNGIVERWPTLDDVKIWIEEYVRKASQKELKAQWIASTQRTLQSLCYGEMGRVINTDLPTHIDRLLDQPVILELDALSENDKTLVVQTLLLWIHQYRLQEKDREKLKHVILIEEAHHVLRKEELTAKESILDVVLREIRELGEGIIMIDQSPAQFSQNATGNSATSFVFALKDKSDVMTAANFLLLDQDERAYLHQLPVGTCVVKLSDSYRKPFLIRLPHVRIPKGAITDEGLERTQYLTDEEIEALPGVWRDFSGEVRKLSNIVKELKADPDLVQAIWGEPSENTDTGLFPDAEGFSEPLPDSASSSDAFSSCSPDSGMFPAQDAEPGLFRVVPKTDKKGKGSGTRTSLDEFQILFLKDVLAHPYSGIRSRYERLRLSAKKGTSVKESLERASIIRLVPVSTGESQLLLVELTPAGQKLVRRLLPDEKTLRALRSPTNGLEHRYWKDRVARALEREGLHVDQEHARKGGGRVDVHAENGHPVAIEVETGKSDVQGNIKKDLRAGYEEVLVLPTSAAARRKVKRALEGMPAKQ